MAGAGTATEKKFQLFIGYHSEDEVLKKRLLQHLKVLERLHNLVILHEVEPGSPMFETVERQLHAADMILLLLTGDFIGSDEHMRQIVEPAIKRGRTADASMVVSVIMRSCLWKITELAGTEVLPENGEPIEEWAIKDLGYRNVANDIKYRIEKLRAAMEVRQLRAENEKLRQEIVQLKGRG